VERTHRQPVFLKEQWTVLLLLLLFEWRKQTACNLREITEIVKYVCNDIDRQNILAKNAIAEKLFNTTSRNLLLLG
jgi:hypothetical protein